MTQSFKQTTLMPTKPRTRHNSADSISSPFFPVTQSFKQTTLIPTKPRTQLGRLNLESLFPHDAELRTDHVDADEAQDTTQLVRLNLESLFPHDAEL